MSVPSASVSPSRTRLRSSRVMLGLSLLSLLTIAFVWRVRAAHSNATSDDPLRGNVEEATDALQTQLLHVPADQQTAFLVKSTRGEGSSLRYAAVDALQNKPEAGVADAVEQAFNDNASEVRKRALEVLPTLDKERGQRLLLAALRDEDTWIREDAVTQIVGLVGRASHVIDRRAVPMLVRVLDDPDPDMYASSANALRKITGNNWRLLRREPLARQLAVLRQWRTWWAANQTRWPAPADFADVPPRAPVLVADCPPYSGQDLHGHAFNADTQQGKITLLNFWASHSGPSRIELPDLQKVQQVYGPRGVEVIGLVTDQPAASELQNFCDQHHLTYRQSYASEEVVRAFDHIHEVPVSILVDAKGKVRARWDGFRDFETFQRALDRVLAQP